MPRSQEAQRYRPWYRTALWRGLRERQLGAEPLCRYCDQVGRVTAATVVDHIQPHRGNWDAFTDPGNLQSLCKPCHDSHATVKDATGRVPGCGVDGWPLDDAHDCRSS